MSSAMLQEHASMQTGNYQAIDKKVVYEFIIMTSNLTGISCRKTGGAILHCLNPAAGTASLMKIMGRFRWNQQSSLVIAEGYQINEL